MRKVIHIVGRKNHGKTGLILELIEEFSRRGYRIGTIKHSSHRHELDQPGKDSHRQRLAGANPAAVVSDGLTGIFITGKASSDIINQLLSLYENCDIVIVEGAHFLDALKVEVWREAVGSEPIAKNMNEISAIISDDAVPVSGRPIWKRSQLSAIADNIISILDIEEKK